MMKTNMKINMKISIVKILTLLFFLILESSRLNFALAKSISPESITTINLSNTDTNRIVCINGQMNDVFFSTDKIGEVPLVGKHGFIKFPIMKKGSKLSYVVKRSEFHFICDGEAYTIMVNPQPIASKVIYLGNSILSTAKENLALMGAMPREEQGIYLTLAALKNELPQNFKVAKEKNLIWKKNIIKGAEIALIRTVKVDGIGLKLKEFILTSKQDQLLDEKRFALSVLSTSARAITVDPIYVQKGHKARVFIVEEATN